jgi:hypothetical protein
MQQKTKKEAKGANYKAKISQKEKCQWQRSKSETQQERNAAKTRTQCD